MEFDDNTGYSLEEFKRMVCYSLSPADTDLPFIPYFDMAITFYLMFIGEGKHIMARYNDIFGTDSSKPSISPVKPDQRDFMTDFLDEVNNGIDKGTLKWTKKHLISPITYDALKLLHCDVSDLLPYARENTPVLNPSKGLKFITDAIILTTETGLYGASAMLDRQTLKDVADILGDNYLILPLAKEYVICIAKSKVNNPSDLLEGNTDIWGDDNTPLDEFQKIIELESKISKKIYQYKSGEVVEM